MAEAAALAGSSVKAGMLQANVFCLCLWFWFKKSTEVLQVKIRDWRPFSHAISFIFESLEKESSLSWRGKLKVPHAGTEIVETTYFCDQGALVPKPFGP